MKNFNVNDQGFYGRFGGAYVPEILHANVEKLRECYLREMEDESFQQEFRLLLRDYVGRPSPLYYARRLSEKYGTRIYLKREDQQYDRSDSIGPAYGKEEDHCRNRSRAARSSDGYCMCPDEYGMYRLYGSDRCGPATT